MRVLAEQHEGANQQSAQPGINVTVLAVDRARLVVLGMAASFALLASWNLWAGYSYWLDEIYSVNTSLAGWGDMFRVWLLSDTHPPLYQALLKVWIYAFGPSESATRTLSLLAALAALAIVTHYALRRGAIYAVATVGFFGSAGTFAYYAEETRSYALMMLLATIATVQSLNRLSRPDAPWLPRGLVLLLLSLTHYFGLIFAAVLLLIDIIRARNWRMRFIAVGTGCTLLVWPFIHANQGSLLRRSETLWFPHDSFLTTLGAYLGGVAAAPVAVIGKVEAIAGRPVAFALAAILVAVVGAGLRRSSRDGDQEAIYLACVLGAFVGLLIVVDYIKPLSWPRNYIVALPATAFLFGSVFVAWTRMIDARWWRALTIAALAAFVVGSTAYTLRIMAFKWAPHQDVKGLLSVLYAGGYCSPRCDLLGYGSGVMRMYSELLGTPLAIRDLGEEDFEIASDAAPIIIWTAPALIAVVADAKPGWSCLQPSGQSWPNAIVVFLPPDIVAPGLVACAPFRSGPDA